LHCEGYVPLKCDESIGIELSFLSFLQISAEDNQMSCSLNEPTLTVVHSYGSERISPLVACDKDEPKLLSSVAK
ncbi:hypothetical protein GW17_00030541, partial [Ensete ventricosum]